LYVCLFTLYNVPHSDKRETENKISGQSLQSDVDRSVTGRAVTVNPRLSTLEVLGRWRHSWYDDYSDDGYDDNWWRWL